MDTALGNTARLTNDPGLDTFPSVSPNGKEIAFVSQRNDATFPNPEGDLELYVMDIADDDHDGVGDRWRRLTNDAASQGNPAWSPGGRKIAFSGFQDGDGDVYLIDADGSEPAVNLTNVAGEPATRFDGQPAISPDGTRIAFMSNRTGTADVYLMDIDGSNQRLLTSHPGSDSQPEFSPDASMLAFVSRRHGNPDIHLMRAAPEGPANTPVNLTNTNDPFIAVWPAWSPDGTRIAFWHATGAGFGPDAEIYLVDVDGTDLVNLTNTAGGDITPDWGLRRQ